MELLTLREAARRLNVCEPIAKRLLSPYGVPVGKRVRYPLAAVERVAARGAR